MIYKNLQKDFKPMSIMEFKANLEISYRDTTDNKKIEKLYKIYIKNYEKKS